MRALFEVVRDTVQAWSADRAQRLGAAFAYYTLFSMAPLLFIAITIAGSVFGAAAAQGQIVEAVEHVIGRQAAQALQDLLANVGANRSGLLPSIIGLVVLVFGASNAFNALKDMLNTMWHVTPRPDATVGHGLLRLARDYLLSIVMVGGVGLLLLVSLAANTILSWIETYLSGALPGSDVGVWQWINLGASFALIGLAFVVVYRTLPDAAVALRDAMVGAAVTSLLLVIGTFVIGEYLGRTGLATLFGTAGWIVAVLIWVYYAAQIVFLGAAFTRVFAVRHGRGVQPRRGAIRVEDRPAAPMP